ncbi:MAG: hypothetical protein BAJALOKI1v1_400021 [Promethearchaeota archaeon]|nr:MAG: hypothetical protein BAJALOKI1v1_400021 [Candidatus Lokiarchaeota archaeon]
MVHRYPSTLTELIRKTPSAPKSEQIFFNMLEVLNDKWYAWHSVEWARDLRKEHGEADFLLFHPQKGFVIIEVKGGLITCENGTYYTTDRLHSVKSPLKRSPLAQAKRSMYFLKDYYINKARQHTAKKDLLKRVKDKFLFPLSYSCAVCFIDCEVDEYFEDFHLPRSKVFDHSDIKELQMWKKGGGMGISPLENFLISLLDLYKEGRFVTPKMKDFFIESITPSINTYMNVKHDYDIRAQELERVNEVQDFLIASLAPKLRCMFQGSAGSGKTFIAMKKALSLYKRNQKTLFLCFNKELRDSIEFYICSQLKVSSEQLAENITVETINSLLKTIASHFFEGHQLQQCVHYINDFKSDNLMKYFSPILNSIPDFLKYKAILIDEAQDIDASIAPILLTLLHDIKESLLWIFYDTSQDLFTKHFHPTQFGMEPTRDLIVLTKNLRNTIEIAKFVRKATSMGHYDSYSGITGLKISTKTFSTDRKALLYSIQTIYKKYLSHGITSDQIIILADKRLKNILPKTYNQNYSYYIRFPLKNNDDHKYFFLIEPNHLKDLDELKYRLQINGDYVSLFKTIGGFKGLERDIIFLLLNRNNLERYKKDLYVGSTRAKFKLHLYTY